MVAQNAVKSKKSHLSKKVNPSLTHRSAASSKTANAQQVTVQRNPPSKTVVYSFFAIVLLTIGSTIGIGIYYKTDELMSLNGGNLFFVYGAWIIGIIGISALALSLGLLNKHNAFPNLGILGWIRSINGQRLYTGFKWFLLWILVPFFNFAYAYYCIQAGELAVKSFVGNDFQMPEYLTIIIAFVIIVYFSITCSSPKLAETQNKITSYLRFVPLLFCIIGGIIIGSVFFDADAWKTNIQGYENNINPDQAIQTSLVYLAPVFGLMASMPALIFSFDGFYFPSVTFKYMKKPERGPFAVVIGVMIVALVYVLVFTGILVGANGGGSYQNINLPDNCRWIIGVVACFIIFGMLGVTNSNVLFGCELFRSSYPYILNLNLNKRSNMSLFNVGLNFVYFTVLTVIGIWYFYPDGGSWQGDGIDATRVLNGKLYNLSNLITNWVGTFVFMFLAIAIGGLLFNPKIKKTNLNWVFAIIAVTFMTIVILFQLVDNFFGLYKIATTGIDPTAPNKYNTAEIKTHALVSQVIKTILFFVFLAISFAPLLLKRKHVA